MDDIRWRLVYQRVLEARLGQDLQWQQTCLQCLRGCLQGWLQRY